MNSVVVSHQIEWKDIPGYEGLYQVSNDGQVRSLQMWDGHKYRRRETPKLLKQHDNKVSKGYMIVNLKKPGGHKKDCRVHRLVAMAFIPRVEGKEQINHIDGNTKNNTVENLEWCTPRENIVHAYTTGLKKSFKYDVNEIIRLNTEERLNARQIAELLNTSRDTINYFVRRNNISLKRVSHYGIELPTLKKQFASGMTNMELANIYNCPRDLIARRRYQMKKGEI